MVEKLASGEIITITGLNLMLDPSFFIQQTERLSGTIVLVVSDEENVFFQEKYPVDIGFFDQWEAFRWLPELFVCIVVLNPVLTGVLS